ncbi:MAG: hypothetical protein ACRDIZ_05855 [Actinomycetota bacterium]
MCELEKWVDETPEVQLGHTVEVSWVHKTRFTESFHVTGALKQRLERLEEERDESRRETFRLRQHRDRLGVGVAVVVIVAGVFFLMWRSARAEVSRVSRHVETATEQGDTKGALNVWFLRHDAISAAIQTVGIAREEAEEMAAESYSAGVSDAVDCLDRSSREECNELFYYQAVPSYPGDPGHIPDQAFGRFARIFNRQTDALFDVLCGRSPGTHLVGPEAGISNLSYEGRWADATEWLLEKGCKERNLGAAVSYVDEPFLVGSDDPWEDLVIKLEAEERGIPNWLLGDE